MKPNLFFSVIIPTYNRAEFLLLAIKSVLSQKYTSFEIIVVDDGSTDETEAVIASVKDSRIQYLKIKNSERGAARNTGVRHAKGDYVTFLDSDDILYPNYLSNTLEGLAKYNYPVFFHQAYEVRYYFYEQESYIHKFNSETTKFLVKGNPLSCLGIFIKREEALLFPFNEDRNLSGSEDWELWIRLAANFGLKCDSRISAGLVLHNERSVHVVDEEKLVIRKKLALEYSFKDQMVQKHFGKYLNRMNAYADTYNSLHLVLAGKSKRAIVHLLIASKTYPGCLFERRVLAIFKYLLLDLFKMNKETIASGS